MKLLEKILVAVDFGSATEHTLATAKELSRRFGSEMILIHVARAPDDASPEAAEFAQMARERAEERLANLQKDLQSDGLKDVGISMAEGVPFNEIIREAEHADVNVIVMGAHRDAVSRKSEMGMTAERVCRKSDKPVWVVVPREPSRPEHETKHVLCPIDGSEASRRALRNAIRLCRKIESRLDVQFVAPTARSIAGIDVPISSGKIEAERERIKQWLDEFDFVGVDWAFRFEEGDPGERILAAAEEFPADLIVMGSVGRTGLKKILMGSVAAHVIRALPCSIVTVKERDAVRLKVEQEVHDIREHYAEGMEMLENGFVEEARRRFEHCIQTNNMFLPAWEGLALAFERLGQEHRAETTRKTAKELEEICDWRRIEAEIRSHYTFTPGSHTFF